MVASATFWTMGRRKKFKKILKSAMNVLQIVPDDLDDYVRQNADLSEYSNNKVAGKRTIERFLAGSHKTKSETLSRILVGVAEHVQKLRLPESDQAMLESLLDFYDEYKIVEEIVEDKPKLSKKNDEVVQANSPFSLTKLFNMMLAFIRLPGDASKSAESLFFRESDGEKVNFETYRFSSQVGYIQKSFTVISRYPKMEDNSKIPPVVRFSNYFEYESRVRKSEGIVVCFRQAVALVGHSDNGNSLKVMVLNLMAGAQDKYTGLLITYEPDGGLIASRFLMKRSKAVHHQEVATERLYSVQEINNEIGHRDLISLRNRIDFSLEGKVFNQKKESISQKEMVSLVGNILDQRGKKNGDIALQKEDGSLFNPADHENYTFNAALKIRS